MYLSACSKTQKRKESRGGTVHASPSSRMVSVISKRQAGLVRSIKDIINKTPTCKNNKGLTAYIKIPIESHMGSAPEIEPNASRQVVFQDCTLAFGVVPLLKFTGIPARDSARSSTRNFAKGRVSIALRNSDAAVLISAGQSLQGMSITWP